MFFLRLSSNILRPLNISLKISSIAHNIHPGDLEYIDHRTTEYCIILIIL